MNVTKYGALLIFTLARSVCAGKYFSICTPNDSSTVGDYNVEDYDGNPTINLTSKYPGKVVMAVNVATFCGLNYQYHQMNAIISTLTSFTIVGFPCNQFNHEEPAANETELLNGLKHVRPGSNFIPMFDLMKKIDVNGVQEAPLYTYLKESCQSPSNSYFDKNRIYADILKPHDITWNFEKFLIDERGRPTFRFMPQVEPDDLLDIITDMISGVATKEQLEAHLLEVDRINKDRVNIC